MNGEMLIRTISVSVSAQDGIVALGKAHTRSTRSPRSLPKVALETVPIFVSLNTDRSRPWRVECRPLPFSTPLSFRRSMLSCSGLSVLNKFLKPRSTSALPSCRSDVISAVLASLSASHQNKKVRSRVSQYLLFFSVPKVGFRLLPRNRGGSLVNRAGGQRQLRQENN